MPKRVLTGRVKSDKMDKTRVVQIARLVPVEIIESAPLSKKKRWSLVSVVEKSNEVDVTAMKAARKLKEQAAEDDQAAKEAKEAAKAELKAKQAPAEKTEEAAAEPASE